jgi:hypothetical protein
MIRTDLLLPKEVASQLKKVVEIKNYLIYAATGDIEKNDANALPHLKNLNDLESHLKDLLDNLEADLIAFDDFKATGIREE